MYAPRLHPLSFRSRLSVYSLTALLAAVQPMAAQEPERPQLPRVVIEGGREIDVWVVEDHGATESCARILVTADASAPERVEGGPPNELDVVQAGERTRVCIGASTPIHRASDDVTGAGEPLGPSSIEVGTRVRMWVEDYQFQTNPPRVRAIRIEIPG
jgi:hypothetical protein